jgi:hypothetical protein
VLSKGRYENCLTAKFLIHDKQEFYLVVEQQEHDEYASRYPEANILVLPPESTGHGAIPVRNFIWEHSIENGYDWHWEFDDNIRSIKRWYKGKRIVCDSKAVLCCIEDFADRYENIAIAGLNYAMFCPGAYMRDTPFALNVHVYSGMLIRNEVKSRWRGKYNADTDLCLQVLADDWCTVLTNVFMIDKMKTMTVKGGNTANYQGDGRLKMANSLKRQWPHAVRVERRFKRPQHVIYDNWRRFDTPLIRRKDIDFDSIPPNEYGLKLKAIQEVKSESLKNLLKETNG